MQAKTTYYSSTYRKERPPGTAIRPKNTAYTEVAKTVGDRHVVTRTTLPREPKAKVVFFSTKNYFRLERPQNVTK